MDPPPTPNSPPAPPSLFPITSSTTTPHAPFSLFPVTTSTSTDLTSSSPHWLRNTSFTTDLSLIPDPTASRPTNLDNTPEIPFPSPNPPSCDLLESSESDNKDKKRKKKKKKKREKKYDVDRFVYGSRKSGVRAWANSSELKPSKDYIFDARGDPDNLAFGSLYKMDIVRYKLHDGKKSLGSDLQMYSRVTHRSLLMRGELDVDGLDSRLKSNGRYWSAKYSAVERHRNFKRIRIVGPQKHVQVLFDDFVPLLEEESDRPSVSGGSMIEESWEDQILRKPREFNKMTREQPHNVRIWLDFAEFQDKVASRQPQKGARLQTLEKKISILEKAAELNPEDEELLVCLLKAYQNKDSADVLIARWEKVLMQHSGSCKLWKEFLLVVQADFSAFKVSKLRKMYAHAIQALAAASMKKHSFTQLWNCLLQGAWMLTLKLVSLMCFSVSAGLNGRQVIVSWLLPCFRLK